MADRGGECFVVLCQVCFSLLRAGRARFPGLGALVVRIAHFFPFVQQAGIDLPDHGRQVKFHLAHLIVLGRIGHGLREHFENAVEVAQQDALGALQFVVANVIGEGAERLKHLTRDGLGTDVFLAHPRMPVGEGVEGGINKFAVGFGIFQLFQLFHALIVFQPLHLHLRHFLRFNFVQLLAQDDVGIVHD